MKRIVAVIGSLRKESVNRIIFEEYKNLSEQQFKFEEGSIGDLPHYSDDIESTPQGVTKICEQIRNADGVIFFSPEYNYSVPGVLKNALDWISRDENQPLARKPSAIIGASPGNIGTARMQYHLRQIGVFLDIDFLNKPEVMIGNVYAKIKEGKLSDSKTSEFLKKHVGFFEKHIQK